MEFKDHFSAASTDYGQYRPRYPLALFDWLAEQCRSIGSGQTSTAWDCATGTGQAAYGLTGYFERVIASDASREQIETALKQQAEQLNERQSTELVKPVDFRVCSAEKSGLADDSIDLATVAQAFHWLDSVAFAVEAKRVLKSDGLLAVWTYGLATIDPLIDAHIHFLYDKILGPYWPPERSLVEEGYDSIILPMTEIETAQFTMTATWNLEQLLGYLGTWSAVRRYARDNATDPVRLLADKLGALWTKPEQTRTVIWPLKLRLWKND